MLGDTVTEIGRKAFEDWSSLNSATLGSAVITIGNKGFRETAIASVTIPNSTTVYYIFTFKF